MKKLLLLFGFLVFSGNAFSQQFTKEHLQVSQNDKEKVSPALFGESVIEANSTSLFSPNMDIGSALSPWIVKAGDYNNDSNPDIFTAGFDSDSLLLFQGNGDGTFSNEILIDTLDGPITLDVSDYNNDGYDDISTTTFFNDEVLVYLNNGDGTYGDGTVISANTNVDGVFTMYSADVTGNSFNDIIVGSVNDDKVSYYPNNGDGTFGSQSVITINADSVLSVTSADLDNDGDEDVLFASANDNKIAWHSNQGSGNFTSEVTISTDVLTASYVTARDVNDDGFPDVVAASEGNNAVYLYLNNGNGTFANPDTISNNASLAVNVQITDVNLDGNQDIVAASYGDSKIVWFAGNGDGTFGTENVISELAYGVQSIAISDIDGDTDPDILSAYYSSDEIEWHENLAASGNVISITDIKPNAAAPGSNITIYGSGFSETASQNTVEFGNTSGTVQSALSNKLVVEVPDVTPGFNKVSVTNSGTTTEFKGKFSVLNTINASFSDAMNISTEVSRPQSVVTADLNGDGDLDIVVGALIDGKVAWFENSGNNTFGTEQIISTDNDWVRTIYAVDLDNDGDIDIISGSYNDNKVAWYENDGNGNFSSQSIISTSVEAVQEVYAADLNGDGYIDVLSASENDNKIAWYQNNGDGTFENQQIISTSATSARSVHAADLDNDGDLDVLSASSGVVSWYENDGSGSFGSKQDFGSISSTTTAVRATDIDNDGDTDAIYIAGGELGWFINNGSGSFGSKQIIDNATTGGSSLHLADLDGDGLLDLLVTYSSNDKVSWYKNSGNGNFSTENVLNENADAASSVFASDLNNDGNLDILSTSNNDNKIDWYENTDTTSGSITSINDARQLSIGTEVTVRGMITRAHDEVRKIQQGSAGMHLFGSSSFNTTLYNANLSVGDSVQITGSVGEFQGLKELTDISDVQVISSNNDLPEPISINLSEVSDFEQYESVLVHVENLSTDNSGENFQNDSSYDLYEDGSVSNIDLFIGTSNLTEYGGETIPELFNFTGIVNQSSSTGSDGYTLYPINLGDITALRTFELLSIKDTKARQDGDTVRVRGVAISPNIEPDTRTSFYIQDEGVGINIFKLETPIKEIALGDSIEVVGELTTFRGLREIVVDDIDNNITILNSGNDIPDPRIISHDEFVAAGDTTTDALNIQGSLVRVSGLTTDPSTWPGNSSASSTSVTATDFNGNNYPVRLFAGTEAIGVTPSQYIDLIGVLGSFDGAQLQPRLESDIIELDTPGPQNLVASETSTSIDLSWDASPLDGMDGYNVYRSTSAFTDSSSATNLNSSLITSTSFSDNTVEENTRYYYRVSAYDRDNDLITSLSNETVANFKIYSIYAVDRTFGDVGSQITFYGTNLSSTTLQYSVQIGSSSASVTSATSNNVTIQIPSISPGTYPVYVSLNGNNIPVHELVTVLNDESEQSGFFQDAETLSSSVNGISTIRLPDLDNDEDRDILASLYNTSTTDNVVWLENSSTNPFSSTDNIGEEGDSRARDVVMGDFNGDEDLDIAAVYDRSIVWYENDGNGNFSTNQNSTVGALPFRTSYNTQKLLAFDVDRDGSIDLIHAHQLEDDITYYRNIGGGEFEQQELIDTNAPLVNAMTAGDIDGDGDYDIVASLEASDQIVSYINNTSSFGTSNELTSSVNAPRAVALGDLDGDGDLDLISVSVDDDKIAWYSNDNGSGAYPTKNTITQSISNPISVAIADLDGDDDLDIVVGTEGGQILWFANQGSGSISSTPTTLLSGAGEIRTLSIGDLDDDGRLDIIAGDYSNGELLFLRNVDTPPAPPTGVTIAQGIGEISLEWNANTESDLQGYDVIRSTDPDDEFTSVLNSLTTSTSYNDNDVVNGRTYYYKIVAVDETGTRVESEDLVSVRAISTQISTIEPMMAAPGSSVILWGIAFSETQSQNEVKFGTTSANILDSNSEFIRVEVPSSASGWEDITVTSEGNEYTYPAPFLVLNQNEATFTQPITESGYNGAGNIVTADIDGDGTGDLIATRPGSSQISMLFSDGEDPFSRSINFNYSSTIDPSVIRAVNLYGEDYPDFVFITNNNQFRVLKNNGGATTSSSFMDQSIISVPHNQLTDIYTADMNADGFSDVILASSGDSKISWYANESSESDVAFGSENNITQSASGVASIYAADFNGDNLTDVVAALKDADDIRLYVNNGDGSFSGSELTSFGDVTDPVKVYSADLDGDGDMDILSASNGDIIAFENDGFGNFTSTTISTSIGEASDVLAADINGDGDMDILASSRSNDTYFWYQNNGSFSFSNGTQLPGTYSGAHALAAYDMDENGQLDIAVRSSNNGDLGVSRNLSITGIQVQNFIPGSNGNISVNDEVELEFDTNLNELGDVESWFQNAITVINDDGDTFNPSNLTFSGSSIFIESEDMYTLDTLYVSISSETISENSNGQLYLDVNGNGLRDSNEGDYTTSEFYTTMIGDFDLDFDVDFDDLTVFSDAWRNNDLDFETGPISFGFNLDFPNAYLNPDSDFNIDDLVAFIRFWNYSQEQSESQKASQFAAQTSDDSSLQNNHIINQISGTKGDQLDGETGHSSTKESLNSNAKSKSSTSLSDSLNFITYEKVEPDNEYISNPNAYRKITYSFSLSHPDSVMGLSLVIDYDENSLNIANIENQDLFNIQSSNANVFLSHIDSTNGILTLNVANFGPLSSIHDRDIVSLTFESRVDQDSDLIIRSDIRAKGKPAIQQITKKAVAVSADLPEIFNLSQNYPNPFNPTTTIHYELAEQSRVNLTVYDILGRQVETLLNENNIRPGYYKVGWDASQYASGMYIYVMNVQTDKGNHHLISRKMLLVK